ncbi:MAG: pyruvate, phosphate dikinase [Candidatus Thermoplasmatota archaeon]|jgi:pyruvate,orthophosphate dikinase|nr:pyruvate, phosphate dikinase [Candidatus Thermoplasmatota archaeon]MCL5680529.1 pyruvate, phosphate dikinase [Candidatus Thermoplasmatota archaeon]
MAGDKKYIYTFEEGSKEMKNLLGGKGAGLAEMTRIGLRTPPGFTITTEACNFYFQNGRLPEGLWDDVVKSMGNLESRTGRKFGGSPKILLVSVRSGAPVSMPGMLDTVLNLGLNSVNVDVLAAETGNQRFAWDSYRRFVQMFGRIVLGINGRKFDDILELKKTERNVKNDYELSVGDWQDIVKEFREIIKSEGKELPDDPYEQLSLAINAIFDSWKNERAVVYRKINNIPDSLGTAVSVVTMVYGNTGTNSATGVCFTRDPNTGEKKLYGEYLVNAQGEDVVAGIRTPSPIEKLKAEIPKSYDDLERSAEILESHYKDVQDIEFTIQDGTFYLLQTRSAKRSAFAAVKIAIDFLKEKKVSPSQAVNMVEPFQIDQLLHPQVNVTVAGNPIAKGLAASPGAGSGKIVLQPDEAVTMNQNGEKVVLVRNETLADDVHGIAVSQAVLTARGGMTSHAAVVARAMGKPAIVGSEDVKIELGERTVRFRGIELKEHEEITVDGTTGLVFKGKVPLIAPELGNEFQEFMKVCKRVKKLGVLANANTPEEALLARKNGAEGIGLARTERMFLGADRIPVMREMIMSDNYEARKKLLEKLLPLQYNDFVEFFRTMDGFPVIIRLLDPPLHEFLPKKEDLMVELTELKYELKSRNTKGKDKVRKTVAEKEGILKKVNALSEFNPMIGFRGIRVGVVYPEIYEMQTRAIIRAALKVKEEGRTVIPEIMIPLTIEKRELATVRDRLIPVIKEELKGKDLTYKFGTMIETPRGALMAGEIAETAEFFSFGTNDLTQMTLGFSRDDVEATFLPKYLELGIFPKNPFESLDRSGVGELMRICTERGIKKRPEIEIGICGEHGGDPDSVKFCHEIGLKYVSASPFRIPIAILAAAQANSSNYKGDY